MRAPAFWDASPGPLAALLAPAATVWDGVGRLRRALAQPYRSPVPIVCVGNLTVGGAGKTPVVLSLAGLFSQRGVAAHIVSRGYGGRLSRDGAIVRVDPARHDAAAVGDEPLLLAAEAACWIGRDRAAAAKAAVAAGADLVVLDDGFQNPAIAKNLSFLVVDAAYGFGNGRVMPAGPLRERVSAGIARADAIVLIGNEAAPPGVGALPVLRATLAPLAGDRFAGTRVVAFAGIGRPGKFFATLSSLGADLVAARGFPDHHPFRPEEIDALRRESDRRGARLVTTAKDLVRLPPDRRDGIEALEVTLRWNDPPALAGLLDAVVLSAGGNAGRPTDLDR